MLLAMNLNNFATVSINLLTKDKNSILLTHTEWMHGVTIMNVKSLVSLFFLNLALFSSFSFATDSTVSDSIKPTRQLIVSYGPHNAAPFAIVDGDRLIGGTVKEIAEELADMLDLDIRYVQTPRKRIERYLETGQIHLILTSNPKFLKESDKYQWSVPIFTDQNVLVVRKDDPKSYKQLEDMVGMNVGTIRGYFYTTLAGLLEKKLITRSDVRSLDSNFGRLRLERIDSFIDSRMLVEYRFKEQQVTDLVVTPIQMDKHFIHGTLSTDAPISLTELNTAIKELKEQGIIDAILAKYSFDTSQLH